MTIRVPPQLPAATPSRIAFVGEAPSTEELLKGQPFVGPAGRVFNAIMRFAELDRDDYLITNVFDEMAPDNDLQKAGWYHDEGRIAENFARLNEELEYAKPNVIVPLGGTALWAFTGQRQIGNYRGAVTKASRIREGAKLVPTYHPSAIQKSWQLLSIAAGDFVKASQEADLGPEITYPKVDLLIEPTLDDIKWFVPQCLASPKLSVDIETGWGQITAIAFAPNTSVAMSIPFVDLRKPSKSYWPTLGNEFEAWRLVEQICNSDAPKLGQNFMYDIMWLYTKHGVTLRNYRYDTRLRHKVMYPELQADLANMSASYTRIGAYKGWGGRYQDDKKDG